MGLDKWKRIGFGAFVCAFCFTAIVSQAQDFKSDDLVGTWRYEEVTRTAEGTFRNDGTYLATITKAGKVTLKIEGKWAMREGMIFYEITKSTEVLLVPGTKDRDRLIELTADHYIVETLDGSRRKYLRVKSETKPDAKATDAKASGEKSG